MIHLGKKGHTEIRVEGRDASEVQRVAEALSSQHGERADRRTESAWLSGSFYLVSLLLLVGLMAVAARFVSPLLLPVVVIGGILAVSAVGALQLRQDDRLGEESFVRLMALTIRQLPMLKHSKNSSTD